jgi:hypothetical protein
VSNIVSLIPMREAKATKRIVATAELISVLSDAIREMRACGAPSKEISRALRIAAAELDRYGGEPGV